MSLEVNLTICPQRAPSLGREPKKASRCGVPVKRPGLEPDRPGLLFSLGHCVTLTSCFPSPSLCFLFYKMRMMTQALWSGGCENLWTLRCEGMGDVKVWEMASRPRVRTHSGSQGHQQGHTDANKGAAAWAWVRPPTEERRWGIGS